MSLSKQDIEKVAKLANLHVSEQDIIIYESELNKILGYIDRLSQVNTEGIEPLASSLISEDILSREDIIDESQQINTFRDNLSLFAIEMEENFFKVPKMGS